MFITIENLRAVEWGRAHLYNINFPNNPPGGFNGGWIPAVNVSRNIAMTKSKVLELGTGTYEFPMSTESFKVSIDFVDDVAHSMQKWYEDWVNKVTFSSGKGLEYLYNVARLMLIQKYDLDHSTVIQTWQDWVIPDAGISWKGGSEATPVTNTLNLIVVGNVEAGV